MVGEGGGGVACDWRVVGGRVACSGAGGGLGSVTKGLGFIRKPGRRGGQEGFSSWIPAAPGFLKQLVWSTNRIGTVNKDSDRMSAAADITTGSMSKSWTEQRCLEGSVGWGGGWAWPPLGVPGAPRRPLHGTRLWLRSVRLSGSDL